MPETRLAGDFLFSSRFQGAQIPGAGELHAGYPGEAAGAFAEPIASEDKFAAGSPAEDTRRGGFFSRLCPPFCAGKRKMGQDQGERNGYSSVDCRRGAPCRFFGYQQGEDLRLWRKSPERSALCPGYSGDGRPEGGAAVCSGWQTLFLRPRCGELEQPDGYGAYPQSLFRLWLLFHHPER